MLFQRRGNRTARTGLGDDVVDAAMGLAGGSPITAGPTFAIAHVTVLGTVRLWLLNCAPGLAMTSTMLPAMGAPTEPRTAGSALSRPMLAPPLPNAFSFSGTSTSRGTPFTSAVHKSTLSARMDLRGDLLLQRQLHQTQHHVHLCAASAAGIDLTKFDLLMHSAAPPPAVQKKVAIASSL